MALTEEREFQSLLKEKNHKEMINVLTKILIELKTEAPPPTEGLENMLKEIAERPVDKTVPTAINAISKEIVKKLNEIKEAYVPKPTEWKFDVHYTKDDKVDYVTVRGK